MDGHEGIYLWRQLCNFPFHLPAELQNTHCIYWISLLDVLGMYRRSDDIMSLAQRE